LGGGGTAARFLFSLGTIVKTLVNKFILTTPTMFINTTNIKKGTKVPL
jgi:hypothetical protein